MLRIEVERLIGWWWDVYSKNNKMILESAQIVKCKSTVMKAVNNFISTTGMTVVSETKHRDGTVTILVKKVQKYVIRI